MERREFLRIIPLAAVAPEVVRDGVVRMELPGPGHYVFIYDMTKIDGQTLMKYPAGSLLPKGATGGWLIGVEGNPDEALKIYKLAEVKP